MTKPFLSAVAEAYLTNEPERLIDFCFVFPNKRSATYFTDHLATLSRTTGQRVVHPATTTIVDFVESFSDKAHGDRLELIFILYGIYRDVVRKHHGEKEAASIDFNRFIYWADILLNDFDDVDNSLTDADELFKNVGDLKEISANYLTPEQIEVIRRFWNEDKVPREVQDFWNHIAHPTSEDNPQALASTGFLRLWQVMGEIYHGFHDALTCLGLHTSGMAYREAVEKLNELLAADLPYRRYIFVGFNSLSAAERKIFSLLQNLHEEESGISMADFYWDIASPAFNDPNMAGGRLVKDYSQIFPSLYDCIQPLESFPQINIIGVPSRIGQSKVIGEILGSLYGKKKLTFEETTLRDTAIVLPEENMLVPLLNSLPPNLTPLNITMGYKLRDTAVAGLIRDIVSMQMRCYKSKNYTTFFHEDVVNVLSHPLIRSFKPLVCTAILLEIQASRLFNVPESLFAEPRFSGMEPVFRAVSDKDSTVDVFGYLSELLKWLADAIGTIPVASDEKSEDVHPYPFGHTISANRQDCQRGRSAMIQEAFLCRYSNAVSRLKNLSEKYLADGRVFLENATVFNLVERMVQGEMANFEGVPLKGFQIMGVLEARSLDFDTLLIPSMNERVFPRARFTASFIPVVLRNAYRLPTPEEQENVYAYFFYRMISRSKKVFLLYDARSTGLRSRQMSRYIHQLVHIFKPEGLIRKILPYHLSTPLKTDIAIEKTPEIMAVIERFRSKDNPLYLSASSIKQYVGCPMSFYFERIAHYRREDEMNDWMDESVLGTVVHEVFEKLFGHMLDGKNEGVIVTKEMLQKLCHDISVIEREICLSINRHYRKLGENSLQPLTGDTKLIGLIIKEQVREVLRKEQAQAPFTYLHGEWKACDMLRIKGTGKYIDINFNCIIDRVDFFNGDGTFPRVRIIDYKTGSDEISFNSMEQVFHDFKKKAFLQVMLYAQAYAQFCRCEKSIQPMIYSLKRLMVAPIEPVSGPPPLNGAAVEHATLKMPATARGHKWNILDYKDYVTQFNDTLIPYLEDLFNPNIPFKCADSNDACRYCAFTAICGREDKP